MFPSVTVIIATADRPSDLERTLADLRVGTVLPAEVRVVDASIDEATALLCQRDWSPLVVAYLRSPIRSAAQQRNQGAAGCTTELILFCDDDVELPPTTLATLVEVFAADEVGRVGGVAGIIEGYHSRRPSRVLRLYYRLQAGYDHATFGGKYFGAGINVLPTVSSAHDGLILSDWLNSTLVLYRTDLFQKEQFPRMVGYSFQEDVHLSNRIGRTYNLYFHPGARYIHKSSAGSHKADAFALAHMQFTNRWYNAESLLGLRGLQRVAKFTLSQLFDTLSVLRMRPTRWRESLRGSWTAWWRLAIRHQNLSPYEETPPLPSSRLLRVLLRLYEGVLSRYRNAVYRRLGVRMDGYVWMRAIEVPRNWGDIHLGNEVALDRGVTLLCSGDITGNKLHIGAGTYVNRNTMFDAHRQLHIGQECMIGPNCYLTDGNHGMKADQSVKSQPMEAKPVILEDEVWLGAGVNVLAGVRIGKGAVIGAGSVVTSDIPAGAIAVGVPARVVRLRQ